MCPGCRDQSDPGRSVDRIRPTAWKQSPRCGGTVRTYLDGMGDPGSGSPIPSSEAMPDAQALQAARPCCQQTRSIPVAHGQSLQHRSLASRT